MKSIHERAAGYPALLAGLLAALGAACGGGGEAPVAPSVSRSAHTALGDGSDVIVLRDRTGAAIPVGSTTPYSPERTCGGCHDFSLVTQGYHFQQGKEVVADAYNPSKPWLLSDGMYGKW